MTTARRQRKPTLADKLVLWERAYVAVLDRLMSDGAQGAVVVAAAARTAAILIQGVDDDRP